MFWGVEVRNSDWLDVFSNLVAACNLYFVYALCVLYTAVEILPLSLLYIKVSSWEGSKERDPLPFEKILLI